MIVVTGGGGFIGSVLLWKLNLEGFNRIVVVDDFGESDKWKNFSKRDIYLTVHKDDFHSWLKDAGQKEKIECVFHMGACSSTAEKNMDYLIRNNFNYSISLFNYCRDFQIPFFYASSAATYGEGAQGYDDEHEKIRHLRPINPYGFSKQLFDSWVLKQEKFPPFWAGFKFFNVFGPSEYHKESMRSLVCKAIPQIQKSKSLKLFKSYRNGVAHGEQKRDFVYVKDVVEVLYHFWQHSRNRGEIQSGIYNVGSGTARSFVDLGNAIFKSMQIKSQFEWIEMPQEIKDGYQYFTEANLDRLRNLAKYEKPFTPLEDAVDDYVKNYLLSADPYI